MNMKLKQIILALIFFIGFVEFSSAQQLPLFSQYRENQVLLNPAILSSDYIRNFGTIKPNINLGISYRHQWAKIEAAPQTYSLRGDYLFEDHNVLVGAIFLGDDTSPTGTYGGQARFAYLIDLGNGFSSKRSVVSVGLSLGYYNFTFVNDSEILTDEGDPTALSNRSYSYLDADFGVFYFTEINNYDIFYAGFSAPQIVTVDRWEELEERVKKDIHYYFQTGFYHYIGSAYGDDMFLEPSVWVKWIPNAPLQTDFNFRFKTPSPLWVGLGASLAYDSAQEKQIQFNNLNLEIGIEFITVDDRIMKIGYAFGNTTFNSYGSYLGSMHEINFSYSWIR